MYSFAPFFLRKAFIWRTYVVGSRRFYTSNCLVYRFTARAVAGYAGGRTDNYIMRFVDVMYAFPDILLIILLRSVLGGSIFMISTIW
jgi:ABC-type microcin C transport system permease subunit YejE